MTKSKKTASGSSAQTQIIPPDGVDGSVFSDGGLNCMRVTCLHRSAGCHRRREGNFTGQQQQGSRDVDLTNFEQSRRRQRHFLTN